MDGDSHTFLVSLLRDGWRSSYLFVSLLRDGWRSSYLFVSLLRDGWRQPQGPAAIITTAAKDPSLFEPAPHKGHGYKDASLLRDGWRSSYLFVSLLRDGWRQPQGPAAIITTAAKDPSLFEQNYHFINQKK
jgi:hypothetical protein